MDNQTRTLLITVALAVLILYVARPKNSLLNSKTASSKTAPPSTMSDKDNIENKNGQIAISAMREALNDNLPQREIDKLSALLFSKYKLKVLFGENKKLIAKNLNGKIVAREQ